MFTRIRRRAIVLGVIVGVVAVLPAAAAGRSAFIDRFGKIDTIASTVPTSGPAMGDQNPYGVAVVPRTTGNLVRGDVLVSNFNNSQNQHGTGSSIVEVSPNGTTRVFAVVPQPTATPAVGLTTALVALRNGFVVVGSLPASGGMSSAAAAGALTILDARGHVVKTLSGGDINGSWDMTAVERGHRAVLFVTNVLQRNRRRRRHGGRRWDGRSDHAQFSPRTHSGRHVERGNRERIR